MTLCALYIYPNKTRKPENSMGMGTSTTIQNPMSMGMGMGMDMTLKNGYVCEYSSTHLEPAPCPSLFRPQK